MGLGVGNEEDMKRRGNLETWKTSSLDYQEAEQENSSNA